MSRRCCTMCAESKTSSNAERGEPMATQSDNNPEKNAENRQNGITAGRRVRMRTQPLAYRSAVKPSVKLIHIGLDQDCRTA
jgi:hypothetical protein